MTVLRINKREKNFLILDKTCLNTQALSWGAKGLHTYLMSLPHDWNLKVTDLMKRGSNGRDSIRNLINELKNAGYIQTEWLRDEVTGKYTNLEYIVHETPVEFDSSEDDGLPETRNPGTEKPSPVNPCPEKPTLININNTKDLVNKKITAAEYENDLGKNRAAAVFKESKNQNIKLTPARAIAGHAENISAEDSVVGSALTNNQHLRILGVINELKNQDPTLDPDPLYREVTHCLLNKNSFTACGRDFGRKLHAIRKVIQRGDWQTPAALVLETQNKSSQIVRNLECELRETHAEINHFKRLLMTARDDVRPQIENIMAGAQIKKERLEKEHMRMASKQGEKGRISSFL